MEQRMMRPNAAPTRGRRAARRRPLVRLVLALFAATLLATLPAASPHGVLPIVSAHNLNQRMVYLFFDPATKALLDARIPTLTPPEPLLQVGDEIGMIIKVIPTDGTTTGVGGYIDFYVPNGVTVVDAAYVLPNLAGGYDEVNMKGQALMPSVGAGGGPTVSLVGLTRGPNALGVTSPIVDAANVNLGTVVGVYGDTGIFYSTDPETAFGSWVALKGGGTITSNSGDVFSPYNAWDAEQMAAYGIKGTTNPNWPATPLIDSNGRGNAPWGLANVVAGPQSGYAWDFDIDDYAACDPVPYAPSKACIDAATDQIGPWNRLRYPGSQISDDPPGNNPPVQPYTSGADGSNVGFDLSPASPLASTVSQTDTTSPKAIRWAVGQLTNGRPEYAYVKFRVDDLAAIVDATGCPIFNADTFGGDAGGDSGGKDHEWRYYDPTKVTWNGCLAVGKPATRQAVKVGDTFQYKIAVYNTSPTQDLSSVVVRDTLPSGVQFISAVPAQNSGPNPLVWNVGSLLRGQKFEATVTVKASSSGILENTVVATGVTTPGGDPITSTATESTLAGSYPILKQSKSVSPTAIAPGGNVQYTVTIENIGSGPSISPIKIEEHLPTGFSYLSLDSVQVNGANALGSTTVNASQPNDPVFTIAQPINADKKLVLRFSATTSPNLSPGTGYCNVFTSITNVPLTTGSEACVTIGGAAIGDTVYRDWNGDGSQDPLTEEGIAGVTVNLYAGSCPPMGGVIRSDLTDASGGYLLNGLTAGDYCVETIPPAGHTVTGDPQGALDGYATVSLAENQENFDIDFGLRPGGAGSIGDLVFEDLGNDGSYDPGAGDAGIPNVTVNLYEDTNGNGLIDAGDALIATTQTDGSGLYGFGGLALGFSYIVDVDAADPDLATYFSGAPTLQTTLDPHPVPSLAGSYGAADFGFYEIVPGSIGDEVCIDANADGSCAGEARLPNVSVRLYRDSNGNGELDLGEPLLATTSTDIDGLYSFGNLPPGNYIVDVDQNDPDVPGGHFSSADLIPVSLGFGENRTDVDFPFVRIMDKTVDKPKADAGETLTYAITVRYPGTKLLSNVMVTDPIPAGTTYVGGSASPPLASGPDPLKWNLGTNDEGTVGRKQGAFLCVVDTTLSVLADTYVREDNAGNNFGARTLLETNPANNGAGTNERQGLLRFDITGVPAGATIKLANLSVVNTSSRNNHVVELREATRAWTEGTQTGSACGTGASWNAPNCTDTGTGWNGAGGNFRSAPAPWGATVLGTMSAASTGTKTVSGANMRQLVQDWVTGAKVNRGLVMLATGTDTGQADWGTRENGNGATLALRYEFLQTGGCPSNLTLAVAADTYVREDDATDNFGARTLMETNPANNGAGNNERQGLLRFSTSAIPAGATITGATLEVENTGSRNNHLVQVREALRAWTEGTQTGSACSTGASWNAPNCSDTVTGWNGLGGNFRAMPTPWGISVLGTLDASSTGTKSISGGGLTALVQAWVDGSKPNRGLVLLATGTDGGQAQWGVKENGNGARLVVSYLSEIVTADLPVVADAYVREDRAGRNYGASTTLETNPENNGAGNAERHGLIRFDMTALPTGAVVTGATLRMQNTAARSNHVLSVREALRAWTEGTQADANCSVGASWNAPNCTDTGTGWNGAGGNFRTTPSPWGATVLGTLDAASTGLKTTTSSDLTQLVKDWADGITTNRGFVLLATGTDGGQAQWGVRESGNGAVLRVSYQAPGGGPATRNRISAGPTLVADGDLIQITMALTATETINNVTPTSPIAVSASNGAAAVSCSGPSPASQNVLVGSVALFSYSCVADTSGVTALPAALTFSASAMGDGGVEFVSASSNSVLVAPELTYQVTIDGPPAPVDPVVNTATIMSDSVIPATSDTATTAIQASIGDRVWADLDGQGDQDPGEPGLGGVEVCATPVGGGATLCATTDASGEYRIFGIDDTKDYTVSWTPGTEPTDYVASTPMMLTVTSLQLQAAGGNYTAADFGLRPPGGGSIGDTVWIDADEDGMVDMGELPLAGVTVRLYDSSGINLLATTTTDGSGAYTFDGLYAGDYVVRVDETSPVTTPYGVVTTLAAAMELVSGSASNPVAVNLPTDSSVIDTVDFGYNWAGSIGDTTYYDDNGNGVQDGLEAVATAVVVTLFYDINGNGEFDLGDPLIGILETDGSGTYTFDNLPPGTYFVKAEEQTVESPSTPGLYGTMVPTNGEGIGVSLAPSQDFVDADFGFIEAARVEGHVFHDVSNNGVRDPGEPGLTPVEVTLTGFDIGNNPVSLTTTTDGGGEYSFIVPPGNYTVTYSQPDVLAIDAGLTDVTTVSSYAISPNAGQEIAGLDFGIDHNGVIGDRVYLDANGDGTQQPGEPGLAGVTVQLYDATGTILLAQQATGPDGDYRFEGLADGTYIVRIDASTIPLADPPGFTQTQDPDEAGACSGCDAQGTALVVAGGSDLSLDFGYQPTTILRTISGRVYNDLNGNGSDDDGPGNGFAGVAVSVTCDSGSFMTVSDGDGNWSIDGIPDGSVCSVLDADETDLPSTAFLATEQPAVPITVDADIADLDFGYIEDLGSISGSVCQGDGNGQCTGESVLAGVDVTLTWAGPDGILNTADDETQITQTDAGGSYSFTGLEPGLYQIVETNPAGFDSVADADGGNPDNITTNLAIGEDKTAQDFEDLTTGIPDLVLVKTASLGGSCPGIDPAYATAGDLVTYCYAVTNTGDTYLSDIVIDDDVLGNAACSIPGPLAPGATDGCTAAATVSVDTTNVATATGNPTDELGIDLPGLSNPSDQDDAFVDVVAPAIQVVKSAAPTIILAGATVTYGYVVTNPGDVPLGAVSLGDDVCSPVTGPSPAGDVNSNGLLDPGEAWTYGCAQALGVDTTNTVTATGQPSDPAGNPLPGIDPVQDTDSASVDVVAPAIDVVKSVDQTIVYVGGTVVYGYAVTNPGDVPLAGVVLGDDRCSPVTGPAPGGDANSNGLLDPGETWTYGCTTALGVDTTNTATTTGQPSDATGNPLPGIGPVTDMDSATVNVIDPAIRVVKTADPTLINAGETVAYGYVVTNPGDDPLASVLLVDDVCSPVTGPAAGGDANSNGLLDPGETWTYGCSQALVDDTVNTVTATGVDSLGNPVDDTDMAFVNVVMVGLQLDKTVDKPTIYGGDTVIYSYTATNTGSDPISNVSVTDDQCGPLSFTGGDTNSNGLLDPGEAWTYSCTTALAIDTTNMATLTGDDPLGNPVTPDHAMATVDVINPAIRVLKSVDKAVILAGETVAYGYLVTNPGDDPLANVTLGDDVCSPVTGPAAGGDANSNGLLDPGETWSYGCAQALSLDTTNTATATGDDSLGNPVDDSDSALVDVVAPAIRVVKSADRTTVLPGDTVAFVFVVTNPGDTPLAGVNLVDDRCSPVTGPASGGDANSNGLLDPGETWTYGCSHALADDTTNTVNVAGQPSDPAGNPLPGIAPVSDTDTETVDVVRPNIHVVKSADPAIVYPGDTVVYGYSVTNPGDTPLAPVALGDDTCGPVTGPAPGGDANGNGRLDPGETWVYGCTTTLSLDTTNTVQASGQPTDPAGNPLPGIDPVQDSDTASVNVIAPAIQVLKSADRTLIQSGETVVYQYLVSNPGDDPLANVTLGDDVCGPVTGPAPGGDANSNGLLEPGETWTYTCTQVLTSDTTNTATVSGDDSLGNPVTDTDTETVDVVAPAIAIQKTVYAGQDAGAGCPGSDLVSDFVGTAITYCFAVTNTGDTYLDGLTIDDPDIGITLANMTLLGAPSFPLAPGASATWYYETTIAGDLVNTASVRANPTDAVGNDLPGLTNPSDTDRAEVVDLGSPTSCLGDRVFFDFDNDGRFEPGSGEFGIDGLLINLYRDSDSSGLLSVGDAFVSSATSAAGGRFTFCDLADGDYIVQVDPGNFAPAGTLAFAQSSTGNDVFGAAPDPDDDVDDDDNGSPDIEGGVSTAAVTLLHGAEPTSEDGDASTNLTVDLGFAQREEPTGVRLSGFEAVLRDRETVDLRWSTSSEVGVSGFRILRSSTPEGPYAPVHPDLVPAADVIGGGRYQLVDLPGAPGTYYYRIEVVNDDGSSQVYGAVEVVIEPLPANRLFLPALWQRDPGM